TYETPVMFTGSCFAAEMGEMLSGGRMKTLVNPFGVLYNPASVARQFEALMSGYTFSKEDLICHNGKYLSLDHGTGFSNRDPVSVLDQINMKTKMAAEFLGDAGFLFITFGTARVFRWNKTGRIVSNCHKIAPDNFTRELLSVEAVAESWISLLKKLKEFNPGINVIFTVSPVRHWKDGAHGNQVSKAVLLLAIEKIIEAIDFAGYFPSYELLLDDLRDYRFYSADMLHPTTLAADYIGAFFRETFFDIKTIQIFREVSSIALAGKHRTAGMDTDDIAGFSRIMLGKISILQEKYPFVNLSGDRNYFESLTEGKRV
ncbi:MAG: GSCFA domain-containing protein, partial [Bacteroidales bacterium]|nr:GSCFA domain-containing protein [Bacteroidales bacterium]